MSGNHRPTAGFDTATHEHIDDDTLTLIATGVRRLAELDDTVAKITRCPVCHRLVSGALHDLEATTAETPVSVPFRRKVRAAVSLGAAVAAGIALFLVIGSFRPFGARLKVLPTDARIAFSGELGAPGDPDSFLTVVGDHSYEVQPNATIRIPIDSPGAGEAVVVQLQNGSADVSTTITVHGRGSSDERLDVYRYVDAPAKQAKLLVVVTDAVGTKPLRQTVQWIIDHGGAADLEQMTPKARRWLEADGHKWAGVRALNVKPKQVSAGK